MLQKMLAVKNEFINTWKAVDRIIDTYPSPAYFLSLNESKNSLKTITTITITFPRSMFKSINLSFLHFRVDFICFLSFARHKGREGGEIPHTELGKKNKKTKQK